MAENAQDPNAELNQLLESSLTPGWLIELIPTLLEKDPVDVTSVFEVVHGILERRLNTMLGNAQDNAEITSACQGCRQIFQQEELHRVLVDIPPIGPTNLAYCSNCKDAHDRLFAHDVADDEVGDLVDTLSGLGMNVSPFSFEDGDVPPMGPHGSDTYPDGTPLAPGDSLDDNPQGGA